MLTDVVVVPPEGAYWPSFSMPVQRFDGSGIFVEKVEGLEPVQAEITTVGYNLRDGESYVGSRVPKRNIVLHMKFEDISYGTINDARKTIYGYFMPKMNVSLMFVFTDRDPVKIDGWVESCSGDRFSNDPDMSVSVICPKPNFYREDFITVSGESYYGSDPPLTDVLNEGDRMVGIKLRIINDMSVEFNGDIKIERLIEGAIPGEYFSTQQLYLADVNLPDSSYGQYLWVETNQGKKKIELRNGDDDSRVASYMGYMSDDSTWIQLWSAMNKFRVVTTNTTGWTGNHLNWILTYTYEFGGV